MTTNRSGSGSRRIASALAALFVAVAAGLSGALPASAEPVEQPAASVAAPSPGVDLEFFPRIGDTYPTGYPDGAEVPLLPGSYHTQWGARNASSTDTVTVHLAVDDVNQCDAVLAPGEQLDCSSRFIAVNDGSSQPAAATGTVTDAAGTVTPIAGSVTVVASDGGLSSWVSFALPDGRSTVLTGGGTAELPVGAPVPMQIGIVSTTAAGSTGTRFEWPGGCASVPPADLPAGSLVCTDDGGGSQVSQGERLFTVVAHGTDPVTGAALTTRIEYAWRGAGVCELGSAAVAPGGIQSVSCTGFYPGLTVRVLQTRSAESGGSAPAFTTEVAADGTFSGSYTVPAEAVPGPQSLAIGDGGSLLFQTGLFDVTAAAAQPPATTPDEPADASAELAATGLDGAAQALTAGAAAVAVLGGLLVIRLRRGARRARRG